MRIKPAIHSSFPRIGEQPEEQRLRRGFASLEEGKISSNEFKQVENRLVDEIVALEEKAGLEVVTDGLIRWYDSPSHLARSLIGFEINGLLRFFDTNTYYRQPVAHDELAPGDGALALEAEYLCSLTTRPIKTVILGPLSLAGMSQNKSSLGFEKLCLKLAEIVSGEIARIASKGAAYIQVEEPWLARNPEYFDLFKEAFDKLVPAKGKAKLILAFYFGDIGKIFKRLPQVSPDMIAIDFTYSPGLLERISSDGFPGPISFGILDGRNTRLESASEIARTLEPALAKIDGRECHITTSCGLEYLPRGYAIKKLELTSEVARLING